MIRVEIDETISRPIEKVFDRLVDISGYSAWMPEEGLFVSSTQDSEGPVGAGTRYSDKTRLGTVQGEVSVFVRPKKVVFHYTAHRFGMTLMEGWPGYVLEPDGDVGTRIHHHAEGRLYGVFKLLQPLVQMMAHRERRRTVDALKKSFESVEN